MKIEAYFTGIKNANKAVEQLKNSGFTNSVVDINDHYIDYNSGVRPILPGNEGAPNLSSMVLNSGENVDDPSKKPLGAASPMVSGMGGFEELTDINYKVIVNLDEKDESRAKEVIGEMGGDFNDPNLDLPHRLEDISLDGRDLDL